MNARDALHMELITRDELRILINETYAIFAPNDEMRFMLMGMTTTLPLFWVISHFLNEVHYHSWNLAIVFAENPIMFKQCLENGDMRPYLEQYPSAEML